MKKHFLVLDSFRGLCACIVAMSHFNANSIFHNSSIFDRGSIYVDFFFVLSGFVIFANYKDKIREGYSITKFTLLRLGRLYPLHFVVMMGFIGIDLLQMVFNFGNAALYAPFSAPGESFADVVAILLLVHSLHINHDLAFNGPSWSISVEFFTYIIFAFILTYSGRFYRIVIASLSMGCAILLYYLYGELYAKLDYGILRCIFGFGAGALTWDLYERFYPYMRGVLLKKLTANFVEATIFTAAVLYIAFFSFDASSMLAPFIFSVVVFCFAFEGGWISKFLRLRPFVFVGGLSYSIYMIHLFISGKFFALPIRLLETRFGLDITVKQNDLELYGRDILSGTCLEIFYLVTVIAFSLVSYKLIEEPCRKWTKKKVNSF